MVVVVAVVLVVVYLSIYLSICKLENEAFLRDILSFWTWQHQKTQQFCETSSTFELDNVKNETSLRDLLIFWSWQHQKRSNSLRLPAKIESWVQSWRPRTNAFCDCSTPPVWSTAPATKKWCLKIWCSKMQPLSGNQRPDLLTALMNMSLVLRLPGKCIFADPLQMSHACHRFWKCYKTLTFCSLLTLDKVHNPLRLPRKTTFERPKVVQAWRFLYILTSKCASRHNGVQFFISHLARWLRTRRFSEPTFWPSGATHHWKNTVNRDFSPFRAPASSFLWLFLFSDLPSSSLLWLFPPLSILSEVWLLYFLRLYFTYIYIYVCKNACMSVWVYIYIYIYIHVCCAHIHVYVCTYLLKLYLNKK